MTIQYTLVYKRLLSGEVLRRPLVWDMFLIKVLNSLQVNLR